MYLLTLPRRLCFHSVLQDYAKTTTTSASIARVWRYKNVIITITITTNFHKIAGKVAGRAGCALRGGAKPSGRDMTI